MGINAKCEYKFCQEVLDWLAINLNHSKYSYSEKTNDLAITIHANALLLTQHEIINLNYA